MVSAAQSRIRIHADSEEDHRLIRNELTELLKSEHFSNSKRYPAFLSHIVEKTLAGRWDELKERTLGVEVFHRPADYDTNNDTIVRVTAGEVRKRLALIYLESHVERAIQITLPAGSYVPEFYRATSQEPPTPSISKDLAVDYRVPRAELESLTPTSVSAPSRPKWRKRAVLFATMVLVVGAVALMLDHFRAAPRPTSVDLFWQPVHSTSAAIICPGAVVRAATPSGIAMASRTDDYPYTSMTTAIAIADVVNLFAKEHIEYVIQPTSSTTLADMRERPLILIGAYTNLWTGRLQSELRYRFVEDPGRQIYDSMNPSTTWTRPPSVPVRQQDDYAIVARFRSKVTGNLVVLIAGIGMNGTEAATQFVTSARHLDLLNQDQSKDWASRNVEIVLKTQVIDGKSGPSTIEAVYVW